MYRYKTMYLQIIKNLKKNQEKLSPFCHCKNAIEYIIYLN